MINNLEDALIESLKRNNVDLNDRELVKKYSVILANKIVNGEYNYVTNNNGARDYVESLNHSKIVRCMQEKCLKPYLDLNELIPHYADYICSCCIKKDNDIYSVIISMIKNMNFNDDYKNFLISDLNRGNVDSLWGLIDDNILNQYIKELESDNKKKK